MFHGRLQQILWLVNLNIILESEYLSDQNAYDVGRSPINNPHHEFDCDPHKKHSLKNPYIFDNIDIGRLRWPRY